MEPIKKIKKVDICEHTKKEVIQIYQDGEWICLHNENVEDDAREVEEFYRQQFGQQKARIDALMR